MFFSLSNVFILFCFVFGFFGHFRVVAALDTDWNGDKSNRILVTQRQVMWVRRTVDKFSLLSVGNITHTGDPRFKVTFQYPNNWRLHINPMLKDDAGLYMCQVSTHPPRVFTTNVTVLRKYKSTGCYFNQIRSVVLFLPAIASAHLVIINIHGQTQANMLSCHCDMNINDIVISG